MLCNNTGIIKGKLRSSYIYFIVLDRFIYIGETQKIPIIRWQNHLTKNGSHYKNILKFDSEIFNINPEYSFFSYECADLKVDSSMIKRETQYIEDKIHRLFCENRLSCIYDLISDTTRTAPKHPQNKNRSNKIAEDILKCFMSDL